MKKISLVCLLLTTIVCFGNKPINFDLNSNASKILSPTKTFTMRFRACAGVWTGNVCWGIYTETEIVIEMPDFPDESKTSIPKSVEGVISKDGKKIEFINLPPKTTKIEFQEDIKFSKEQNGDKATILIKKGSYLVSSNNKSISTSLVINGKKIN